MSATKRQAAALELLRDIEGLLLDVAKEGGTHLSGKAALDLAAALNRARRVLTP